MPKDEFGLIKDDWRDRAKCRGMAAEEGTFDTFFPPADGHGHDNTGTRAKAICEHCPVRIPCRDYAIRNGFETGVFGGLSGKQRRRERRTLRKAEPEYLRELQDVIDEVAAALVG